MKVKYINKASHTVIDDREYIFHENEVKDIPDRLGDYLVKKYPVSFQQVGDSKYKDPIEKQMQEPSKQIQLQPTKRFMIEPSLVCNIKCKFCYHLHRYDTWKDTVKPFAEMKKEIDEGLKRGNKYMDITGGEPTIYPYILDVIKYAKQQKLKVCIITNGIVGKVKTNQLIDAGIDEFLVSRQGKENEHNFITNTGNGYGQQCRFLNQIKEKIDIRFNCVITKFNQNDIYDIAVQLSHYKPKIVNFINMNPHHEWKEKTLEVKEVIADLKKVEIGLKAAISYLENKDIGVNVRYYPMCRIAQKYRRCICNDLQVMFDPYEWDYKTLPKTIERYFEWGRVTSNKNEEKGKPCSECGLQNICGGINKHFHKASNEAYGEIFKPQKIENIDKMDYTYYRKDNRLTLCK
jgi:MoaA/NifB/PqqE/SkfB family radical SAM enzyme